MNRGTQIAYIPMHAEGNIDHPDVEFGFVTSQREGAHFCRYWCAGHLGELRTVACSELTPDDCLVEHESVAQAVVEKWLVEIERVDAEVTAYFQGGRE